MRTMAMISKGRDVRPAVMVVLSAVALGLLAVLGATGCGGRSYLERPGEGPGQGSSRQDGGDADQASPAAPAPDAGQSTPVPDAGGTSPSDGGSDVDVADAGEGCAALDSAGCVRNPACQLVQCEGCCQREARCYPADVDVDCPDVDCTDLRCASPCDGQDEIGCWQDGRCRADYCPACDGSGGDVFTGCTWPDEPRTSCPAYYACPQPDCANLDEAACSAAPLCHSLYRDDSQVCDCSGPDCCISFAGCAPGKVADCTGPASCLSAEPYCSGGYVLGYRDSCFEGCVRASSCRFSCAGLGESECGLRPDCFPQYCAGGASNQPRFFACQPGNQTPPECPPIP